MGDKFAAALAIVLFVVVAVGGVFGLNYMRYRECRAHGFSVFYCLSSR